MMLMLFCVASEVNVTASTIQTYCTCFSLSVVYESFNCEMVVSPTHQRFASAPDVIGEFDIELGNCTLVGLFATWTSLGSHVI